MLPSTIGAEAFLTSLVVQMRDTPAGLAETTGEG